MPLSEVPGKRHVDILGRIWTSYVYERNRLLDIIAPSESSAFLGNVAVDSCRVKNVQMHEVIGGADLNQIIPSLKLLRNPYPGFGNFSATLLYVPMDISSKDMIGEFPKVACDDSDKSSRVTVALWGKASRDSKATLERIRDTERYCHFMDMLRAMGPDLYFGIESLVPRDE